MSYKRILRGVNAGIYMLTVNMGGSKRKLKCLGILERVKVIRAVDAKLKCKHQIEKEFDIPTSTLSTILKKARHSRSMLQR